MFLNIVHWLKYGWTYSEHTRRWGAVNLGFGNFIYGFSGNSEPCEVKIIDGKKQIKFINSFNEGLCKSEWNEVEDALYFGFPKI